MTEGNDIESRIDEAISNLKMPFSDSSTADAKEKLMMMAEESQPVFSINRRQKVTWWQVAAAVALLIALPFSLYMVGNVSHTNGSNIAVAHTLPDGSQITLNPGSKVDYNTMLWWRSRKVNFEGKGYFVVNPGNEFKVKSPHGEVQVYGTEFTVWADDNDLWVHCSEGSVGVTHADTEIKLTKGEYTACNDGELRAKCKLAHKGFYKPRERGDVLEFENTPFSAVIQELEHVFETEISYTLDHRLNYSGSLQSENMMESLDILCQTFGAKFEAKPDGSISISE